MTVVLVLLAALSIGGGAVGPVIESVTHGGWVESPWLHELPHEAEHASHTFALWCSLAAVAAGAGAGVVVYGVRPTGVLEAFATGPGRAVAVLVENKFYVDELYDRLFARPLRAAADGLWGAVDRALIDRILVEGTGDMVVGAARAAATTQVGAVSGATTAMLAGAIAVLLWLLASHG
jgi:NADH-quinone oxidoreductase subunit L